MEFSSKWRSSRKRGPPFLFWQLTRPDWLPPALATPNLRNDYKVRDRIPGDLEYQAVSDLNGEELQEFATLM